MKCRVRLPLADFAVDVDVETSARAVGVFGASGAGKTSLLECVAGWRRPASGRVEVNGRVLFDDAARVDVPRADRGVGYVPQDGLLFPHWTVERNLRAAARGRGVPEDALATAIEVLELAPLLARDVATCSGGERQRVALGRALASKPDVLLLDEPLGALDRPLRRRVLPYLVRATRAFDLPLLFVSHDATEVQAVCDHVVVLERGRVVAEGDPASVLGAAERAGTDFENLLSGTVRVGEDGCALELGGGVRVEVPARDAIDGAPGLYGLRADDVLLAREAPRGLSARNVLEAVVEALDADGQDVLATARLVGAGDPAEDVAGPNTDASQRAPRLRASLTAASVRELGIAAGARVFLVFKTQSCHRLG